MYLPKSKYRVENVGPGKFTQDGRTYVGPVLTTYLGESFAGDSPDAVDETKPLKRIDVGVRKVIETVPLRRIPTEEEYANGSMERYFRQDLRTMKIIELLPDSYESRSKDQASYYTYASGSWILTGSLAPVKVGKWTYPGIYEKNKETIVELEKLLPGISSSQVLYDPAQFVRES